MAYKIPKKVSDVGSGLTSFTRKKIISLASDLQKEKILTRKQYSLIKKDLNLIEKDLKKVAKDSIQEILKIAEDIIEKK
jgi:hypothetical protein